MAVLSRAVSKHRSASTSSWATPTTATIGSKRRSLSPSSAKDSISSKAAGSRSAGDAWRTLRFFLLSSPRWLFYRPGIAMVFLGLIGYALSLPGVKIGRVEFAMNTLVFASLALITGFQAVIFAVAMKTLAVLTGVQ